MTDTNSMDPLPTSQPLSTGLQLGQLLRAARQRRKLTQTAVANRLGLSQNRVSHLELHPDEISFKQLLAWCSVIGLQLRLGNRDASTPPAEQTEW